jgi:hypothetical protein
MAVESAAVGFERGHRPANLGRRLSGRLIREKPAHWYRLRDRLDAV